jgi:hypothetical protein
MVASAAFFRAAGQDPRSRGPARPQADQDPVLRQTRADPTAASHERTERRDCVAIGANSQAGPQSRETQSQYGPRRRTQTGRTTVSLGSARATMCFKGVLDHGLVRVARRVIDGANETQEARAMWRLSEPALHGLEYARARPTWMSRARPAAAPSRQADGATSAAAAPSRARAHRRPRRQMRLPCQ